MNNPLHAAHYADEAVHCDATVTNCLSLATDTYRIRMECPEIAARILPGQFVMIRQPGSAEPVLGRAFALYDVVANESGQAHALDIVFHTVGKLTNILANKRSGDKLSVWGPLGNGFLPEPTKHLVMVAGGIGQTPFLALAKEAMGLADYGRAGVGVERATLCYGARSASYFAGLDDFRGTGLDLKLATDDGSAGKHGLVTKLLEEVLSEVPHHGLRVVCCGPEKMMQAVSEICQREKVPCQVSLETPMACGIGICFSCVTRVRQSDGSWDYKRTCVDGPVFDADSIVWEN